MEYVDKKNAHGGNDVPRKHWMQDENVINNLKRCQYACGCVRIRKCENK
jgi:hypothetical protein